MTESKDRDKMLKVERSKKKLFFYIAREAQKTGSLYLPNETLLARRKWRAIRQKLSNRKTSLRILYPVRLSSIFEGRYRASGAGNSIGNSES